ncbi:biliverdin reductase A isoform X2 [Brachionichthys hirsutus]|uniref:biliverdin reductase A isoform X2 n=1 Tax=Brachionichthys hirsutus TaxID=412623 RepID=UPI00360442DD
MFGAVVVGVGAAGQVRIRDLLTPLPGSPAQKLRACGFISRRSLEPQRGVRQMPVEEAASRDDVHVAFICTENVSHEENIRTFLQAGKHVCVEYPMCLSYRAAVELLDLAQEKGVILHEEHIELLSGGYIELKRQVEGKTLCEGTLHFTATAATLEENSSKDYSKMTAQLRTSGSRSLTWIEERGPGLPRAKSINLRFDSCTLTEMPPAPSGPVGLFMQDLVLFSSKILGQVSLEELQRERTRVLHCLKLAETIQQLVQC